MRGRELSAGAKVVILATLAVDDEGDFGYRPVLNDVFDTPGDGC
jgi:hypothetical protein